jgi:hypothetical protein
MLVFIERSDDDFGYYIVETDGTLVCELLFADYIDAKNYCIDDRLTIGNWE